MASANVLGLVNQLQNLEQCLTDLLMEMAVKIGSLTDSNIFLLVETQEGRKLCGQRHFCQQYLRGCLAPVGADFLFDVDASAAAMRQVAAFNRGVDASVDNAVASVGDSDVTRGDDEVIRPSVCPSSLKDLNRKRPNADQRNSLAASRAKISRQSTPNDARVAPSDDPEVVFIKAECEIDNRVESALPPKKIQSLFKTENGDAFFLNDSFSSNEIPLTMNQQFSRLG